MEKVIVNLSYYNTSFFNGPAYCSLSEVDSILSNFTSDCGGVIIELEEGEYYVLQTICFRDLEYPVTIKGKGINKTIIKGLTLNNSTTNSCSTGFLFDTSQMQEYGSHCILQTELTTSSFKIWAKHDGVESDEGLLGDILGMEFESADMEKYYDHIDSSTFIVIQTKWLAIRAYIASIRPSSNDNSYIYEFQTEKLSRSINIRDLFEGEIIGTNQLKCNNNNELAKDKGINHAFDFNIAYHANVQQYLVGSNAKIFLCNYIRKDSTAPDAPYLTCDRSSGKVNFYDTNNDLIQEKYLQGTETFFHIACCNHFIIEDIQFENNIIKDAVYSSTEQAEEELENSINIENSSDVTIKNCRFINIHGYAIGIDTKYKDGNNTLGSNHVNISNNKIENTNGGGIHLSGNSHNCIIENNLITKYGRYQRGCVGILLRDCDTIIVKRNTIADAPYSGISVGWSWDYFSPNGHSNIITNNHVFKCPTTYPSTWGQQIIPYGLSDGGGIYLLGRNYGTVVENNVVHDINTLSNNGAGIYLDECSSDISVRKNICWGCDKGVNHNKGRACDIFYNVLANNDVHIHETTREPHLKSFIHDNIFFISPFPENANIIRANVILRNENEAELLFYNNFAMINPNNDFIKMGLSILHGNLSFDNNAEGFPIYGFYTNPRINLTFNVPYSTDTIEICNFLGLRLPEVCLELECARSRIFEKGMYGSSLLPTD